MEDILIDGQRYLTDKLQHKPGLRMLVAYKRELVNRVSPFQRIQVFETRDFGNALYLDGILQVTEGDHFCYHEMLTHVPFLAHSGEQVRNVLVVGDGDGGIITELVKYSTIETIHWVEIDREVVEVCREYLPSIGAGAGDSRVDLSFRDANASSYLPDFYDLILLGIGDPIGPGEILHTSQFFMKMRTALRKEGILAVQAGTAFPDPYIFEQLSEAVYAFNHRRYYWTLVPTYTPGYIGFLLLSTTPPGETVGQWYPFGLRYFNEKVFSATFVKPNCFRRGGRK